MKKPHALLGLFTLLCVTTGCETQQSQVEAEPQRPNILWLTFEDTSAYELSAYGNQSINTPNLEALANKGLVFQNASSNAPYCSPARASLISGSYATTFGADHHRAAVDAPDSRLYFPELLKNAGYFTTNNHKRDYNVKLDKKALNAVWNEHNKTASYNSPARKDGQPFFSVFNFHGTHMSRLTSYTTEERRNFTESAGVAVDARPSYLPDLYEVRSDHQFHLEGVVDTDTWVGLFIDDLKARGLYDNTIIFVYSDHGGSSPLGKGYLSQSRSLQVPLIIHVPERYQHLIPAMSEKTLENKLVSFIDFGPTVLSLAGVKTPELMQGQPFLGQFANHNRSYNYSFRTNQETHFDPWRGVTDGQFSYVKTYLKRKPIMLRNDFQWGMPSNIALDDHAQTTEGKAFAEPLYGFKQGEYLYDLNNDAFEEHSIAGDRSYQAKLNELRQQVSAHIRNSNDLGFIPVAFKKKKPFEQWSKPDFKLNELHDLVERVAEVTVDDIAELTQQLSSQHAVMRFWAAQGFAELAASGQLNKVPESLRKVANGDRPAIAAVALEALVYTKEPGALKQLLANQSKDHRRSALETLAHLRPNQLLAEKKWLFSQLDPKTGRIIKQALGLKTAKSIVTNKQKKKGLKVNRERRSLTPTPNTTIQ